MKIQLSEAINLFGALKSCDGHTKVVNENGQEKSVYTLYELGFDVRFAIAKNINELEQAYKLYVRNRDEMIKQFASNKEAINIEKEPEAFATFRAKEAEMLRSEIEIDIAKLSKEQVAKSALPASVLAVLMPIIEG
jgi:hypothetical protein